MIVSRIDPESRSTSVSAEGFRALAVGDTVLARQKFSEAGSILETGAKLTVALPEKNLLRFLAASQYYQGGEYRKAQRLTQRIREKHLSEFDREKFREFCKSVRARSDDEYASRVKFSLLKAWEQHKTQEVLKLLQDHPYVLERAALAFLRADLCYSNRNWRAAALFYSDSIRFSDHHPKRIFVCAAGALALHTTGYPEDAWQYTQELLTYAPIALNFITACALRFYKLAEGDRASGSEIIELFNQAKSAFRSLPRMTKADPMVQEYMAFGFFIAIATSVWLKDSEQVMRLSQEAAEFDPNGIYSQAVQTILVDDLTGPDSLFEKTTRVSAIFKERFQSNQEAAIRSIAA